jgi:integrase
MPVFKRKYKSGKIAWRYVFDLPGSRKANRLKAQASGFATKKEATDAEASRRVEEQEKARLAAIADKSVSAPPPKMLAGLLDEFFREYSDRKLAPKTAERYREQAAYLSADLLAMPIEDITPLHLSREWNRLLESGGHHRTTKAPRPLSTKTVRNVAGVVSSAFTKASKWGIAKVNPVIGSDPPVIKKRIGLALTPQQQTLLIEAIWEHQFLGMFLEMSAATGARRGEVLALRWSDIVDGRAFIARSLSQTKGNLWFKPPKNGRPRVVTLPSSAVDALEIHRKRQDVFRFQFGPDYRRDLDLIFAKEDGSELRPDSVSSAVSALCDRLKLPKGASLHTLRHTHGSHLLAAGMELTAVSERLGHSSPYVTATVYAHAISGRDEEAAKKWEEFQQKHAPKRYEVSRGN